jgi:tRNA dimethylallyltransferase
LNDRPPEHVLFIIGPTASGKSRLAIEIVRLLDGEIVSADSRQIYQFMDIGTAKPSLEDRRRVPHHLIGIRTPDTVFSAGEFGSLARTTIDDVLMRKKIPIVVGGSGLYVQALTDGVFQGNYRDKAVRQKLNFQAERDGLDALYLRLGEIDPDAARKIHPNDQKRIVRALEVYELTHQSITYMQKTKTKPADFTPRLYGLDWPRAQLYRRIELRVDAMIRDGLVREVENLERMEYTTELNALDSVGYKEAFQYLQGALSFEDMVLLIKQNTRRFAKRQMTWFRRDQRIRWIPVSEPVDWDRLASDVVRDFLNR